ncbi:hypothetical protein Vafri_1403 [Volvox africanus]|nr:hypothetical protein Vafri_1403 [Volvox africanus]
MIPLTQAAMSSVGLTAGKRLDACWTVPQPLSAAVAAVAPLPLSSHTPDAPSLEVLAGELGAAAAVAAAVEAAPIAELYDPDKLGGAGATVNCGTATAAEVAAEPYCPTPLLVQLPLLLYAPLPPQPPRCRAPVTSTGGAASRGRVLSCPGPTTGAAWSGESMMRAATDTSPKALPDAVVVDGADCELALGCCCACCCSPRNLTATGWKSSQLAAPKVRLTSPGGGGAATAVVSLSPVSPCFGARSVSDVTLFQKTSRHAV